MKTYFLLLSFVAFNTLNLALIVPSLTFLFNTSGSSEVYAKPDSLWNVMGNFNYYSQDINRAYQPTEPFCLSVL
ncbi:hypothetical protein [Arcticibacter sp.]|uniref:hypothetical protein n=1 Tax=Arcticibacter sp. TaxID=1872630 RepID=UPI00388F524E